MRDLHVPGGSAPVEIDPLLDSDQVRSLLLTMKSDLFNGLNEKLGRVRELLSTFPAEQTYDSIHYFGVSRAQDFASEERSFIAGQKSLSSAVKTAELIKERLDREQERRDEAKVLFERAVSACDEWKGRPWLSRILAGKAGAQLQQELSEAYSELNLRSDDLRRSRDDLSSQQRAVGKGERNLRTQGLRLIDALLNDLSAQIESFTPVLNHPALRTPLDEMLIEERARPALETESRRTGTAMPDELKEEILSLLREELASRAEGAFGTTDEFRRREERFQRMRPFESGPYSGQIRQAENSVSASFGINRLSPQKGYDRIFELGLGKLKKDALAVLVTGIESTGMFNASEIEQLKETAKLTLHIRGAEEAGVETLKELSSPMGGIERFTAIQRDEALSEFFGCEALIELRDMIVSRLFSEVLLPGGYESWDGTYAAAAMTELNSPLTPGFFVLHIQHCGSGHTSACVMAHLLEIHRQMSSEERDAAYKEIDPTARAVLDLMLDESSTISRHTNLYFRCSALRESRVTIAREQLVRFLAADGWSEKRQSEYYVGWKADSPAAIAAFLKREDDVVKTIIDSKNAFWISGAPALLEAFSADFDRSRRILGRIVENLAPDCAAGMEQVFGSEAFRKSKYHRQSLLNCSLIFNEVPAGAAYLAEILTRNRGARKDSKRLRRICDYVVALHSLGIQDFSGPSSSEVEALQVELADARGSLGSPQLDKPGRRSVKDRIATLEEELDNLTGLKGLEMTLRGRLISVIGEKLELTADDRAVLDANIDTLISQQILEIIVTLAGTYTVRLHRGSLATLRTVTLKAAAGEFASWRYAHTASQKQLSCLSDDAKTAWIAADEAVVVNSSETGSQRAVQVAMREILRAAMGHAVEYDESAAPDRETVSVNRSVEAFRKLYIETLRKLEELRFDEVVSDGLMLMQLADELEWPQVSVDLSGLGRAAAGEIVQSYEGRLTDDIHALFRIGSSPTETCQSWRSGSYNDCLMAYVADGNKKVMNVQGVGTEVMMRGVLRIVRIFVDPENPPPALLLERPYFISGAEGAFRALFRGVFRKAAATGVPLCVPADIAKENWLRDILLEEAAREGFQTGNPEGEAIPFLIDSSFNSTEYSDALGGRLHHYGGELRAGAQVLLFTQSSVS